MHVTATIIGSSEDALNVHVTRHDQLVLKMLLLLVIGDKVVAKCLSVLVVICLLELVAFTTTIEIVVPPSIN